MAGGLRKLKMPKKPVIDVDSIFFETKNVCPSDLSGGRWCRNGFNHQLMNKRVITLGVAALGVAGAQAADGKIWEVSASLKGFYDDNYTTSPDDLAEESWGIEVSPGVSLSYGQGTDLEINAGYAYGLRWYNDRAGDDQDHGHELALNLNKAFSETSNLMLSESFVVAQEPEVLDPSLSFPLRTEGDNIRNTFQAGYKQALIGNFLGEIGYSNSLFDYDEEYHSALLNRQNNSVNVEGSYYFDRLTELSVGYRFSSTDFDGSDLQVPGLDFLADARDSYSHFAYVGVKRTLANQYQAQARAGVQFADYHNADLMEGIIPDDETSPYVDARLAWTYAENSTLVGGVTLMRGATDLQAADQETAAVYAQLTHRFTDLSPDLYGSLTGRFQNGEISGGGDKLDGKEEDLLLLGVSLSYNITESIWAEIAYNYDELDSDIPRRSFERNYLSFGIGARY